MAFEKRWDAIAPRTLLADGTSQGLITIADAIDLHVKQVIFLKGSALPTKKVQINAVISQTEIIVGEVGSKIDEFTDVSVYSTASASTISSEIQPRPAIPDKEYERASFEEEPVVAKRVIQVDPYGDKYTTKNPFPVSLSDGDVSIGTVNAELEVQLSHIDNFPDAGDVADSVQVGDGQYVLKVNPDGSISVTTSAGASSLEIRKDVVNNITYLGVANPGSDPADPVWKINRIVKSLNNTTGLEDEITLVAGTGIFDQVWDDRVSLFPAEVATDFFERRFERLIPLLTNANWMNLGNFDRVLPSFSGDTATLDYYESGAIIGRAIVKYVNDLDWEINLERYIVDTDGTMLLDDDDTPLSLD